jgi:superfamily II DNA/RNA helicase
VEEIIKQLGITALNEMQEAALNTDPGKDLVLIAPTGSGKTLAYLLPLLNMLENPGAGTQALIIVPSRELALQIGQVFRSMKTRWKVSVCYGGHSVQIEKARLKTAPDILIGTPGRLNYHLQKGHLRPESIRILILDEFDKSLEWGFQAEMEAIVYELSALTRRVLVSATALEKIPGFTGIRNPQKLLFQANRQAAEKRTVQLVRGAARHKPELLFTLLCHLGDTRSLVFCNHREAVERLYTFLSGHGLDIGMFHGGKDQEEREKALIKFRNGTYRVLIATDLAARGLDIEDMDNVIHYQLADEQSYIHRNGRTARMHAEGKVFLVLTEEEEAPDFAAAGTLTLSPQQVLPQPTKWSTLYLSAGKEDKVSKGDVAGFLMKKGGLAKEELGRIDIKDKSSFAAVDKSKAEELTDRLRNEKLKNKKVRMELDRR